MSGEQKEFGPHAGLLACTYQAIYDPATNVAVRTRYLEVLADYNLSPEVSELAEKVSASADAKLFADLVAYLSQEVIDNYETICNQVEEESND